MKKETVLVEKKNLIPEIESTMKDNFVKEVSKATGKEVKYHGIEWTADGILVTYEIGK